MRQTLVRIGPETTGPRPDKENSLLCRRRKRKCHQQTNLCLSQVGWQLRCQPSVTNQRKTRMISIAHSHLWRRPRLAGNYSCLALPIKAWINLETAAAHLNLIEAHYKKVAGLSTSKSFCAINCNNKLESQEVSSLRKSSAKRKMKQQLAAYRTSHSLAQKQLTLLTWKWDY